MKKFNYIFMTVLSILIGLTGCQSFEDELQVDTNPMNGNNILEALLEEKDNSRTIMSEPANGVYKNLWAEYDQIAVYIDGENNPSKYILESGAGTTRATFKGYSKGESYLAIYPHNIAKGLSGNTLSVELPAEQTYEKNSFGPASYPMVAFSNNASLSFKNTCAVLKISMTGNHNIKSIVFKTNDSNTYVSGPASIDLNNMDTPIIKMEGKGSNDLTLLCNGIGLNKKEATDFHIVLPAQTYKGGFTLTINTSTGSMTKSTTEDIVLERSQLRKLTTFACKLDEGIEPSTALKGKGTEESPFLINSLSDLLLMQGAVNSIDGTISLADGSEAVTANVAHYKMTTDISLSEICGAQKGDWTPIADFTTNENVMFRGVFDGDGHTISDLYIKNEKDCQGLFGHIGYGENQEGKIQNLIVKGYVKGSSYCGIICGKQTESSIIENCESHGTVEGKGHIGGITGTNETIIDCINYADVNGEHEFIGGITGSSSHIINGCINMGKVTNLNNYYTGGITGYLNSGKLFNCYNEGTITGSLCVGGIAGYSRQRSKIYNCYNSGSVSGKNVLAGIVGHCDTYEFQPLETEVKNCINWGTVSSDIHPEYIGSICGLNSSYISNCYWLYDEEKKEGMETGIHTTEDRGKTESCFGLSKVHLKGQENYFTSLYTATDGTSYYKVPDALNAWANDYKSKDLELSGWKQESTEDYPTLSGKQAEKPKDDSKPLFELSQTEFRVSGKGGQISINVASNMSYYISSKPEWITETTATSRLVSEKLHVFQVQENPNEEERLGIIVFCNESEQCIPVTVTQKGKVTEDMAWTEKEFWHKSLAMRFTADWCGYCPRLADAFADAQKQLPDKIEVVHMHCDGAQAFSQSNTLAYQFNVTGFPTGIADGRMDVNDSSSLVNAVKETEKTYGTQSGISFDSYITNDELTVEGQLYLKKADKYKITVLLLEGGIVGYQADYVNGEHNDYVHNDVPRLALSDISGDEFATEEDNMVKEFTYKGEIPSKCNKNNLRVLVYVQRAYGSQKVISSGKFGDYYVDNSLSEKVGIEAKLKFVE